MTPASDVERIFFDRLTRALPPAAAGAAADPKRPRLQGNPGFIYE
jgi:hypothetical protein